MEASGATGLTEHGRGRDRPWKVGSFEPHRDMKLVDLRHSRCRPIDVGHAASSGEPRVAGALNDQLFHAIVDCLDEWSYRLDEGMTCPLGAQVDLG